MNGELSVIASITKEAPLLFIDLGIGIVGFIISLGWGKVTGRDMDRDTILFLAEMWGVIALLGMVFAFIL
jgi:hypothetical protein